MSVCSAAGPQSLIRSIERGVETFNRARVAKLREHVAVPARQVPLVQLQVRQFGLIERGQMLRCPIECLSTARAVIRGRQDFTLARPQPSRHDPRHVGLGDLTCLTYQVNGARNVADFGKHEGLLNHRVRQSWRRLCFPRRKPCRLVMPPCRVDITRIECDPRRERLCIGQLRGER
jgi:hypothetical protein